MLVDQLKLLPRVLTWPRPAALRVLGIKSQQESYILIYNEEKYDKVLHLFQAAAAVHCVAGAALRITSHGRPGHTQYACHAGFKRPKYTKAFYERIRGRHVARAERTRHQAGFCVYLCAKNCQDQSGGYFT
jgi:hypothetical protein